MTNSQSAARMLVPAGIAAAVAILAPSLAWAHAGHASGFLAGFAHPFHGLDHVLAAAAIGVWAMRLGGRAAYAVPCAFVAAMAAGAGLGSAGFVLPLSEAVMALSVLLLGVLIALDARLGAVAGALLVGAFAPYHGAAHVQEAATGAALSHALGFLGATVLLHAAGIATAVALRTRPLVLRLAAAPVAVSGLSLLIARTL